MKEISLKLQIFNLRNELDMEQIDEANILNMHINNYDQMSELEVQHSLHESLRPYTFDKKIVSFLESVDNQLSAAPLVFELKQLYKQVERKNLGVLYRQPLISILEIINAMDDDSRMELILNNLSMYDWIAEVKHFLLNISKDPIERQNIINSGKATKVYSIVERVDEGHLAFVGDRWFLLSEADVKQVSSDDYIEDKDKKLELRTLEKIMLLANIDDEKIVFPIDEHLTISVSTKDKAIWLNDKKLESETTLESIFNSPIVPSLKKDYYHLISSAINNLDKFMELDVALKVENILNPYLENFVFNYKENMYLYTKDTRRGSTFYQYENATELIHDVQKELDFDLTKFYENKLSKELKELRTLEDREQQVQTKLKDTNESIEMLAENPELLKESKQLELTYKNLLIHKHQLNKELNTIKAGKLEARKKMIT